MVEKFLEHERKVGDTLCPIDALLQSEYRDLTIRQKEPAEEQKRKRNRRAEIHKELAAHR